MASTLPFPPPSLLHCFFLFLLLLLNVPPPSIVVAQSTTLYSPQPPSPRLHLTRQFRCTTLRNGFQNIWAPDHELVSKDQTSVEITLDRSSGAGFHSKATYRYGFFNAAMKLPGNQYSAGVVTTFYATNVETYPNNHDEIDFEFLGRAAGGEYVLETNVYGDGSVKTGREQRFHLWFDPTAEFHNYSILWTPQHIVFFVDDVPIRELKNVTDRIGKQYPSKPISIHATIWDGSDWATEGGKFKANYSYGPFKASYTNLILSGGCPMTQEAEASAAMFSCSRKFQHLTKMQKQSMKWVRLNYLIYDYCADRRRYPHPPRECARFESSTANYNQSADLPQGKVLSSDAKTSQQIFLSWTSILLSSFRLLLVSYLLQI